MLSFISVFFVIILGIHSHAQTDLVVTNNLINQSQKFVKDIFSYRPPHSLPQDKFLANYMQAKCINYENYNSTGIFGQSISGVGCGIDGVFNFEDSSRAEDTHYTKSKSFNYTWNKFKDSTFHPLYTSILWKYELNSSRSSMLQNLDMKGEFNLITNSGEELSGTQTKHVQLCLKYSPTFYEQTVLEIEYKKNRIVVRKENSQCDPCNQSCSSPRVTVNGQISNTWNAWLVENL